MKNKTEQLKKGEFTMSISKKQAYEIVLNDLKNQNILGEDECKSIAFSLLLIATSNGGS